ncbi:hypothetical protein [Halorarius litoreus]|uniref:hypothetical protein n=1 Tax=Halorarius litoreus TaxID=2962676 RepID=UPI0020CC5D52|nr:hypothetical protein [Halorarius litoreus]
MPRNRFTRFTTTVLALVVVLATLSAPVAATPDDGGLLEGDDSDDDGGLISNTTDTVADTVDSTTDTLGTDDGVSDTTDQATDTVDSTASSVTGATDGAPTDDVASPDDLAFGELPDADSLVESSEDAEEGSASLVGTDGVVDTRNLEFNPDQLPAGTTPVPSQEAPTDQLERTAGTDDLPVSGSDLPLDAVPLTGDAAPVQPEDSPYGSDGQGNFDACRLPADEQDLPLDSVPAPGELGVPTPPGVPLDLLTPQAAAGLVLGVPPRPCEVADPHDPSVDPTEPAQMADRSGGEVGTYQLDAATDGLTYVGGSSGQVDQFRQRGLWAVDADGETVYVLDRTSVSDGTTRHYLFFDGDTLVNYRNATGEGNARVGVLGRHASFGLECSQSDPANASVDPEAVGPTGGSAGPCAYTVDGIPNLPVGPGTVLDAVENPPEPPAVPGVGDLPSNANSMLDL